MTLVVSPEIRDALAEGRPVVALETTIVSHGMPWPENIETALAVEAIVRENGAVPAAIAVLDGRIRVGLGREDLERLAKAKDVAKLSRADLAWAVATGPARGDHGRSHDDRRGPHGHPRVRHRRHRRRAPRCRARASTSPPTSPNWRGPA